MKTNRLLIACVLLAALLLAGCAPRPRVGELQSQSRSIELGDASPVRVEIALGAGDLEVTGGASNLLEADFAYNVARLEPEVAYADGRLVVRQPEVSGLPVLRDIPAYRNEWNLRLYDDVPMALSVDVGAGTSDLQVSDLSLTRLDVVLGAGISTIDLSGAWASGIDVTIDAGAADVSVRLPRDVGVRVAVDPGAARIEAPGLSQAGDVYTNAAYGVSEVTLQISLTAGIGRMRLEVDAAAAAQDGPPDPG